MDGLCSDAFFRALQDSQRRICKVHIVTETTAGRLQAPSVATIGFACTMDNDTLHAVPVLLSTGCTIMQAAHSALEPALDLSTGAA